ISLPSSPSRPLSFSSTGESRRERPVGSACSRQRKAGQSGFQWDGSNRNEDHFEADFLDFKDDRELELEDLKPFAFRASLPQLPNGIRLASWQANLLFEPIEFEGPGGVWCDVDVVEFSYFGAPEPAPKEQLYTEIVDHLSGSGPCIGSGCQ
ncbi:hypothetical protein Dimus_029284, partial [Dionaea muscipula]